MLRLMIALFLLFLSQTTQALSYTVEISEEEVQKKVAAMMPLERKKFFVTVVFSNPKVELAENANQIGIYSQMDISAPGGIKSSGNTKILGSLSYDVDKSAIYFKNPTIVEMNINNMPDIYSSSIKEIVQLIADKMLNSMPIYKLKGGDLQRDIAKAMIKSIVIENKQLLIELELF